MSIKVGDKDLFPYLGNYRPINIYKGEHKLAGWKWAEQGGQEVSFENTYNDFVHVEVDGKSYQDGVPTPDHPIEIHSLNGFDVVSSVEKLSEGQLEEYENVDKINLSLSEPLRSVGDVHDRLFRDDSDGLWKIERNINHVLLDGSQLIAVDSVLENTYRLRYHSEVGRLLHIRTSDGLVKSDRFKTEPNDNWGEDRELTEQDHTYISIRINKSRLNGTTIPDVMNWFRNNPTEVLYIPSTPTIETLDEDLQDKLNNLRSFQDSNYVYTVINDKTDVISETLKPTIHAQLKVKDI